MNLVRAALITTGILAVMVSCAPGPEAVRMGTEGFYPPYNFLDQDGEIAGFERDLGDELCRRADLECTWVLNDWESIIPNLVAGEYDAIMAGMGITEERDRVIDFTQPYVPPSPSVYLARAGAAEQVVDGVIAVQVATIQADYLSQNGVSIREYALAEELVAAVLEGEVDAALIDLEFAQDSLAGREDRLTIVGPEVILDMGVGIGLREGDDRLRDKLNRAIDSMKEDGSLNGLIGEWFGAQAPKF